MSTELLTDGPLPDFQELGGAARSMATQIERLVNFPPLHDSELVLRELRAIRVNTTALQTQITGMQSDITGIRSDITGMQSDITGIRSDIAALQTDVTTINTKVDTLSLEASASRHNFSARLNNAQLRSLQEPLQPLHHYKTDLPIPEFPETSADISGLRTTTLRRVLEALGEVVDRNVDKQRRTLRFALGLAEESRA